MAEEVEWKHGVISYEAYPYFEAAADNASNARKQLSDIEFPERFTGFGDMETIKRSLCICSEGAYKLSGFLTKIGQKMTLADDDSYKDLMRRIDFQKQDILGIRAKAILYRCNGKNPTKDEVEKYLTEKLEFDKSDPYSKAYDRIARRELYKDILDRADEMLFSGYRSGLIHLIPETIAYSIIHPPFLSPFMPSIIDSQKLLNTVRRWDFGGRYDLAKKIDGLDTDLLSYKFGQMNGLIAGEIIMDTLVAEGGAALGLIPNNTGAIEKFQKSPLIKMINGYTYMGQAYISNFKATIASEVGNFMGTVIDDELIKKANTSGRLHAAVTGLNVLGSGMMTGDYGVLPKVFDSEPARALGNGLVHAAGNFTHQIIDNNLGLRDKYDLREAIGMGILGTGCYCVSRGYNAFKKMDSLVSDTTPTGVNTPSTNIGENINVNSSEVPSIVKDNTLYVLASEYASVLASDGVGGDYSYVSGPVKELIKIMQDKIYQ